MPCYYISMRLFIAALFPEKAEDKLKELREMIRSSSSSGSFAPDSNLHLTLAFLGECDGNQKERAEEAIKRISPFYVPITIDRLGYFRRDDGKLWFAEIMENGQLTALHDELASELRALDLPSDSRKFRPHITLGRRVIGDMKPMVIPSFKSEIVSVDLMLSERINGRMVYTSLLSKEALRSG